MTALVGAVQLLIRGQTSETKASLVPSLATSHFYSSTTIMDAGGIGLEHIAVRQLSHKSDMTSSASVQDVRDVAPPVPSAKRGSATNLLSAGGTTTAVQEHENETAEIVIVCEPQGTSLMMGGLHPRASLYERPVNLDAAKSAHAEFRQVMRDAGVKVIGSAIWYQPWLC